MVTRDKAFAPTNAEKKSGFVNSKAILPLLPPYYYRFEFDEARQKPEMSCPLYFAGEMVMARCDSLTFVKLLNPTASEIEMDTEVFYEDPFMYIKSGSRHIYMCDNYRKPYASNFVSPATQPDYAKGKVIPTVSNGVAKLADVQSKIPYAGNYDYRLFPYFSAYNACLEEADEKKKITETLRKKAIEIIMNWQLIHNYSQLALDRLLPDIMKSDKPVNNYVASRDVVKSLYGALNQYKPIQIHYGIELDGNYYRAAELIYQLLIKNHPLPVS